MGGTRVKYTYYLVDEKDVGITDRPRYHPSDTCLLAAKLAGASNLRRHEAHIKYRSATCCAGCGTKLWEEPV